MANEQKSIMADDQRTSIWKFDNPSSNKEHPTMKPVGLYVNAFGKAIKWEKTYE